MEPVRLLRLAIGLLLLPGVLGVLAFLAVNALSVATSNPQAAGGLATAAILLGILCMARPGLESLLGLLTLIWGGLKGRLP